MSEYYTYNEIITQAKKIKNNVEKEYKLGENPQWSYFICKAIITPKKNVTKFYIKPAPASSGDNFGRQIIKKDYMDMAKRLVKYCDTNKTLPNYITVNGKKMKVNDYVYMFARILVYYATNGQFPNYANVNSQAFTKPVVTTNDVYNYFVKVFGSFDNTIDGALKKIAGKGYGYYYDDVYSNKTAIDRMKAGKGVNCTDSCHVFYNIMQQLIALGKYKKVECLHIKCKGGDGHVRLRITAKDGSYFYRDPAAVLDSGVITKNWCSNGTLLSVNPSWFTQNLKR